MLISDVLTHFFLPSGSWLYASCELPQETSLTIQRKVKALACVKHGLYEKFKNQCQTVLPSVNIA